MESGLLSQFFNLVGSPVGMIGLLSGLFITYRARRSPRLAWFLVALCGFAASLSFFRDQFTPEPPPLVFPLQQIRDAGRPLSILMLALLLWLGFNTPHYKSWRQNFFPSAIWALVILQVLIFFKSLAFGSVVFALLAILTFSGVVLMVRLGPARWLQDHYQFHLGVWAIATVSVIFMAVNGYQALYDPYPITFVQGAFLGTTGNPQHAATLLAATIPCLLFMTQMQSQKHWTVFWVVMLVGTLIGLLLTGSRTGVLMALLSFLLFFRQNKKALLQAVVFGGLFGMFFILLGGQIDLVFDPAFLSKQLLNTDNTRAQVWAAMWRNFNNYPIFGAPLRGDRFGYGENSWLAVASTLGIVGLIPLFLFGINSIMMIFKLNQIAIRNPSYTLPTSVIIAGLSSILVGSFFEGFLLGTLSFPLLVLLLYLALGQYLLELSAGLERNQSSPYRDSNVASMMPRQAASPSQELRP
jgi:hypothetical protein